MGDGTVSTDDKSIIKTIVAVAGAAGALPTFWTDASGVKRAIPKEGVEKRDETGKEITGTPAEGQRVFMTFDVPIEGQTIKIAADTYPGTLMNRASRGIVKDTRNNFVNCWKPLTLWARAISSQGA